MQSHQVLFTGQTSASEAFSHDPLLKAKQNMANNSNPNVPGHVQSPLFTKLPLEIREQIYRVFFIGSRQEVGRHAYQSDPNNRYTKIVRNSMPRNKQFALAQACKAVYRESRHIYWSETAVTCAYMSMRANLNAIPFYARPLIRVLEGVAPVDDLVPTGQMDLVQFLGHFPNLEYCQLNRHTVHMYCHYDEIPPEGLLTKSGSDAFRAIAHMLDTNKPPVFVQRLFVLPEKDRNVSESYSPFTCCASSIPHSPNVTEFLNGSRKLIIRFFRGSTGRTSTIPTQDYSSPQGEASRTKRASQR